MVNKTNEDYANIEYTVYDVGGKSLVQMIVQELKSHDFCFSSTTSASQLHSLEPDGNRMYLEFNPNITIEVFGDYRCR